ncbi:MAG: hypothetical protein V4572_02065 [Bacteroidota bacterium]
MQKTTADLRDFSRLGEWLNIDASTKTTSELKNIVSILNSHNATFIIRNADSKPTADLKEIARLASGKVIFEI